MNMSKHRLQAFFTAVLLLCITAWQWYSLIATRTYLQGAAFLCPAFAILIIHAGLFPGAWVKNESSDDKHFTHYLRRQFLSTILIIFALGAGFANVCLMSSLVK